MASNQSVSIAFRGSDQLSPVVRGVKGTLDRFKRDVANGFGLGAGISVFNAATRAMSGAVDIMHESANAARDMTETQTKLDAVFEGSAGTIREWSDGSAESMGVSQQAALDFAGTFGNLFRTVDFQLDQAADMSAAIVTLGADLASFENTTPEDALAALKSGLIGQSEPLSRFGVDVRVARVEQELLAAGIEKTGGAYTEAQKTYGRYLAILAQTTRQQGDFTRTLDGTANQQRILDAKVEDAKANYGGLADEAVRAGTQLASGLVDALQDIADALNNLRRFLDPSAAMDEDVEKGVKSLAGEYNVMAEDVLAFAANEQAASDAMVAATIDESLLTAALEQHELGLQKLDLTQDEMNTAMAEYEASLRGSTVAQEAAKVEIIAHETEVRDLIERFKEAQAVAEKGVTLDVHVNDGELQALRGATPPSAPRPGGWDGDPSTPWPRAAGGPVSSGSTYLIGERGPELLHMGASSGFVSSNRDSFGGGNVYLDGHIVGRLIDQRLGRRFSLTAATGSYRSSD